MEKPSDELQIPIGHCETMNEMWFEVIQQGLMVVKVRVFQISAINYKGLSSRLRTKVPFRIDMTVTLGRLFL